MAGRFTFTSQCKTKFLVMNPKQIAAEHAAKLVKNGMTVGLGTGSTSAYAIEAIGRKVQEGLSIKAVASSIRSEEQAKESGISFIPFSEVDIINIYIDGADEVDSQLNLIKGGGGALLREKILAFSASEFIVIIDESKLVDSLGRFPLPVEVTPFAMELTLKQLQKLNCKTKLRKNEGQLYITDNGNVIADCAFDNIENVSVLHDAINSIPGVVENGLFQKTMVSKVVAGYRNGEVRVLS
jgi:ribose 5-phosphate isomerase A